MQNQGKKKLPRDTRVGRKLWHVVLWNFYFGNCDKEEPTTLNRYVGLASNTRPLRPQNKTLDLNLIYESGTCKHAVSSSLLPKPLFFFLQTLSFKSFTGFFFIFNNFYVFEIELFKLVIEIFNLYVFEIGI